MRDPLGLQGHHGHQADAARPHDHGGLARVGPTLIGRVEAHGQRLDQRALQGAHVVRQLKAQVGLVGHILLEHAVHRRGGEEDHVRAEVILPLPAEFTVAAGLARLQGHPVPDLQVFDGAAHLYHSAPGSWPRTKGGLTT